MPDSRLVIVIDDEPPVRKALRRLLSAANIDVAAFASGQEFLAALPTLRPLCLVVDLHMPGMTGLEVQRELARRGVSIPVVVITAFDEPESRVQCLAAGAAAYLLKPFDDQALLDAIDRAVERNGSSGPTAVPDAGTN